MTQFKHLATQINTQTFVLRKLNFLLQEEANITDSFLLWVVEYCAKHDIPIGKEKRFQNLLMDSKRIMEEIKITSTTLEKICKKPLSDEFLQGRESDEDLTEPFYAFMPFSHLPI